VRVRIGELLRHWRAIRSVSQRELGERAGVSTRHLAFVENGKAHPSRDAVLWLARALRVPESEEAAFLEAAGYLPDEADGGAPDAQLRADLAASLAALAPHPALVHDVRGTIFAANDVLLELLRPFVGEAAQFIGTPSGGHRLLAALRPHLVDQDSLGEAYLRRVRDALLRGHGAPPPALLGLFESLTAADPADQHDAALDRRRPHPLLLRIAVRHGDAVLAYDALTSTLGTPMATNLRALRLVILLRADAPPAPH